jgi:hypothetical protein
MQVMPHVSFLYSVNSSSSQAVEKPRASAKHQRHCVLDNTSVSYPKRCDSNFCSEIKCGRTDICSCPFLLVSRFGNW